MGDLSKLNSMTRDELLAFAHFAYVASPTLLETHLNRETFRVQYPAQSSYMGPAIPVITNENIDGEDKQIAFDFDGPRTEEKTIV